MNDLIIPDNLKVKKIQANNDFLNNQIVLSFENGLGISIVQGIYTYGGSQGLYEIAPLDKNGDLDGSILGFEDDVKGYLTKEDVFKYCEIISKK